MLIDQQEEQSDDESEDGTSDGAQQDYQEAFKTLVDLRGHPIIAAKELLYTHFTMIVEAETIFPGRLLNAENRNNLNHQGQQSSTGVWLESPTRFPIRYRAKLWQLFTVPRIRRALATAIVCMLSQQLCVSLLKYIQGCQE